MPQDIEITVNEDQNGNQNASQNEAPVSIVDHEGETHVHVGEKENNNGRAARDHEERVRNAEAENLRLRADFADLRSRMLSGGVAGTQSPSAPDPWKSQEDSISERERALGISWEAHKAARSLTPELLKEYDQKARDLQQERVNIATQRAIQNTLPTILQATQRQQYSQEYGDVQSNPAANRWARGRYDILLAEGHPDSPATVALAMNDARAQFGMKRSRVPNDHERQQLTGFSGSNRRTSDPKSNVVKMGKAEKGMAMAMYGERFNGDENKVYAQWAKGPGVRAQKAAQKARRQG